MRFPVFVCVVIACVSGATARRARRGVGAVLSARDEAADARAVLGKPQASLDVLVKEADKRLAAPPFINAGAHDFKAAAISSARVPSLPASLGSDRFRGSKPNILIIFTGAARASLSI